MFERIVSRVVLGAIAPVSLFLAGWWGTLALLGDSPLIPWMALGGLVGGLALDVTVLRAQLGSLYAMSPVSQAIVALFYAVMIYGFFMGLPVPLLLVSLGWGFAAVRANGSFDVRAQRADLAARGSAALMFVGCVATAWLAFREPSIASQVRGMLGLSFTPSMTALAIGSVAGGVVLIGLAYAVPVILATRNRGSGGSARAAL